MPVIDLCSGVTIVTGTDTEVGKTVTTAVLAARLLRDGVDVTLVKPAQTGLLPGADGDVHVAGVLAGVAPEHVHELVRLREPLAPTTAGRRAGIPLPTVGDHADRIADLHVRHDAVIVEGAGGLLVGLDGRRRGLLELADAVRDHGLSVRFVVVTRAGLGSLNHTALTCRAIRTHGHEVAGVVIGSWPADPGVAEHCNLAELSDVAGAPLLGIVPAGIGADAEAVCAVAESLD